MPTLQSVLALARKEIRREGMFTVPKDHPRCALTRTQAHDYKAIMQLARKLVNQGQLELAQDDRELSTFELPAPATPK